MEGIRTEKKESDNRNRESFGKKAWSFSMSPPSTVNTAVFWVITIFSLNHDHKQYVYATNML